MGRAGCSGGAGGGGCWGAGGSRGVGRNLPGGALDRMAPGGGALWHNVRTPTPPTSVGPDPRPPGCLLRPSRPHNPVRPSEVWPQGSWAGCYSRSPTRSSSAGNHPSQAGAAAIRSGRQQAEPAGAGRKVLCRAGSRWEVGGKRATVPVGGGVGGGCADAYWRQPDNGAVNTVRTGQHRPTCAVRPLAALFS